MTWNSEVKENLENVIEEKLCDIFIPESCACVWDAKWIRFLWIFFSEQNKRVNRLNIDTYIWLCIGTLVHIDPCELSLLAHALQFTCVNTIDFDHKNFAAKKAR